MRGQLLRNLNQTLLRKTKWIFLFQLTIFYPKWIIKPMAKKGHWIIIFCLIVVWTPLWVLCISSVQFGSNALKTVPYGCIQSASISVRYLRSVFRNMLALFSLYIAQCSFNSLLAINLKMNETYKYSHHLHILTTERCTSI